MTAGHAVFAHHGERLLYRVPEAARMLGLGESKMWELLARGEVESVKIDGARRITREAIEAYVRRLGEGGGDAAG
jgi:excisionase family DNA binding protein